MILIRTFRGGCHGRQVVRFIPGVSQLFTMIYFVDVVCLIDYFENNSRNEHAFTKYLDESCSLGYGRCFYLTSTVCN